MKIKIFINIHPCSATIILLQIKKITEKRFDEIVGDYNMLIMLRSRYLHWNSQFGEIGYAPHYKIDKVHLNVKRWRETEPNS